MATSQLRLERAANLWFNPNPNPMQRNHTVHSVKGRGKTGCYSLYCEKKKKKEEVQQFPRSFISNISSTTSRLHANAEEDFWPFQDVTEFYEKIWKRLIWITKC